MTTGWMRAVRPKRRNAIVEGGARSAWLIFLLLLASAAHAQSFTLSLKSCATVPPSASTFTASDGSLVWWNLWNSAPWTGCQITVPTAGTYTVTGKASSPYSTSFHFAVAGANVGTLAVPATAGWGAYETVSAKTNLPAGAVILSFVRDAQPANIYDLLTFTLNAAPLQSVNLSLSGTLLWDDGSPIQGRIQVQEQRYPDPMWYVLKDLIPDGSGNVSDTVSISTNFADNLQFLFIILDATGKTVQGVLEEPAAGGMFQKIRSVSGFKIIVDKASCAGTQCVLAPGSMPGTLGP